MIIVSRKPIMAGYQLLVFKMLYIYVMLICDTLINYYLLKIWAITTKCEFSKGSRVGIF